jgi:hypothetical protein
MLDHRGRFTGALTFFLVWQVATADPAKTPLYAALRFNFNGSTLNRPLSPVTLIAFFNITRDVQDVSKTAFPLFVCSPSSVPAFLSIYLLSLMTQFMSSRS